MNTKLTLSMDDSVINQAKTYLQTENQSLSKLIEDYFRTLVSVKIDKKPKTSILSEITGIAKSPKSSEKLIEEYLTEKYQ